MIRLACRALVAFLLLASGIPALAAVTAPPVKGPTTFSIPTGKALVEMVRPQASGELVLHLTWRPGPLKLTVLDGKRQVVLEKPDLPGPSAQVAFPVTAAQMNTVLYVKLTSNNKGVVTGTIRVEGSAMKPRTIKPNLTTNLPTVLQQTQARLQAKIEASLQAEASARQTKLKAQYTKLRQVQAQVAAIRLTTITRKFGTLLRNAPLTFTNEAHDVPTPSLTSVNPTLGMPGDWITITGRNFSANVTVHCVITAGQDIPSPEVCMASTTEISFKVPEVTLAQASILGKVYVSAPAPGQRTLTSNQVNCTFRQAVPMLTSVMNYTSMSEGEPWTPVLLYGTGFTSNAEIHWVLNAGTELVTRPDAAASTAQELLTAVPDYQGYAAAFAGTVYVKCGSNSSERRPFTFKPQIVTLYTNGRINAPDTAQFGNGNFLYTRSGDDCYYTNSFGISVIHKKPETPTEAITSFADAWVGSTVNPDLTTDGFFFDFHLKNNWQLDSYTFEKDQADFNTRILESHEGSDYMYIQVWWDTATLNDLTYSISFAIRGPKGVPYL